MPSILLIEDDRTIQMALEFALTRAGYGVSVAGDGEAGLLRALEDRQRGLALGAVEVAVFHDLLQRAADVLFH